MNTIGIGPGSLPNLTAPFSPVARPAVGQEDAQAKEDPLPPVEESAESAGTRNRLDREQPLDADEEGGEGQQRAQQAQQERQDQLEIRDLAARDREVRAHEAAHAAVGGQFAGAPSYTYTRGPNGVRYAVAGEVPISLPQDPNNPEVTLRNAEQVRRAALAPAEPSAQDRRIAAVASQVAQQAQERAAALEETDESEEPAETQEAAGEPRETRTAEAAEESRTEDAGAGREDADTRRRLRAAQQLSGIDRLPDAIAVGSVFDQLA